VAVARDDVTVKSLGASGVLEVAVSDVNPRVAANISNALTRGVVRARLAVSEGQLRRVLANLDPRIENLDRRIARLDARAHLSPQAGSARSALSQQRSSLESERVSAMATAAQQPKPSIISAAAVPSRPDSSGLLPDVVLGTLLGLILGVGVAGLIETLRPTLVGGDALARELNVPLLGDVAAGPDRDVRLGEDGSAIVGRLKIASTAAGVRNVGLLAAGREDLDLPGLARQFDGPQSNGNGRKADHGVDEREGSKTNGRPTWTVKPFDFHSDALGNGAGTGLVVLSPTALKKSELDEVKNLLKVNPGPLLGVVTYTRQSQGRARREH